MSEYAIQKIKFKKDVSLSKIKKHCLKLLGRKKVVVKRLVKSNDVVHLPMKCFISVKQETHRDFTIFIGHLKPSHAKLHGSGFSDIFNKIKSTVSNTISSVFSLRDGFNNKAQAMLQKYGDQQISSISVFRAPVGNSSLMIRIFNGLSTKNIPYDTLFHVGLLVMINGVRIRIEKNEVISIDDVYTLKPQTETISVSYNKQLTLNELLNNTISKIGKEHFFKYSAFVFNCQCITKDILESNGFYSNDIHSFIYQPMEEVLKNMNRFVPIVANAITNTSAYINKLTGGNKLIMEAELKKRSMKDLKSILHEHKKIHSKPFSKLNKAQLIELIIFYNLLEKTDITKLIDSAPISKPKTIKQKREKKVIKVKSPVKVSPVKVSPVKVSPVKVSPVKVSPAKVVKKSTTLKVITLNVWDGFEHIKKDKVMEYMKLIYLEKPDFIFVQEAPQRTYKLETNDYAMVSFAKPNTDSDYENLMTLRRNSSDWKIDDPQIIQSKTCNTSRVSTVQMVTHVSGVQVQISNVHLCGGRFDEEVHSKTKNIKQLQTVKVDMLTNIIDKQSKTIPSIILGDFNSDILAFQDKNNNDKLSFLMKNKYSKEGAQMWHDAPFTLLSSTGYDRVGINKATSKFKTLPDAIWYRGLKIKRKKMLEAQNDGFKYSDHHGISATFKIV